MACTTNHHCEREITKSSFVQKKYKYLYIYNYAESCCSPDGHDEQLVLNDVARLPRLHRSHLAIASFRYVPFVFVIVVFANLRINIQTWRTIETQRAQNRWILK